MAGLSKRAKQQLNKSFLDDMFNAGAKLEQMIEVESWKADGFDTLLDFWNAKCSDLPFTLAEKKPAIYHMLGEGAEPEEIARAVRGVGVAAVESLKQDKAEGVPPEAASTRGRRAVNNDGEVVEIVRKRRDTIFIRLGPDNVEEMEDLSQAVYGQTATQRVVDVALRDLADMRRIKHGPDA